VEVEVEVEVEVHMAAREEGKRRQQPTRANDWFVKVVTYQ
jgi:hypothetical protein